MTDDDRIILVCYACDIDLIALKSDVAGAIRAHARTEGHQYNLKEAEKRYVPGDVYE